MPDHPHTHSDPDRLHVGCPGCIQRVEWDQALAEFHADFFYADDTQLARMAAEADPKVEPTSRAGRLGWLARQELSVRSIFGSPERRRAVS